jgi:hypothetical protein
MKPGMLHCVSRCCATPDFLYDQFVTKLREPLLKQGDLGIGERTAQVIDVTDWEIRRFECSYPLGGWLQNPGTEQ